MPIIKSAIKRMKQTAKRRERNVSTKKEVKGAVKAFLEKPTAASYKAAQSEIDTAVKKGVLNKGTAARRKANLSKVAKEAGVKFDSAKKTAAKTAAPKKAAASKPVAKKPAVKKAAPKKTATK